MKKLVLLFVFALLFSVVAVPGVANADTDEDAACWGQATKVFAMFGDMGEHASEQENPRVGLGNLAVALYEDPDYDLAAPTIQALGAFVAEAAGLSIDACMD